MCSRPSATVWSRAWRSISLEPQTASGDLLAISRAIAMGGTVSGEHGVGIGKIAQIAEEHGEDHINIQRAVKRALDPQNIMNPGKVFILPVHEGGCCDVPDYYHHHETHDGSAGTYSHGE